MRRVPKAMCNCKVMKAHKLHNSDVADLEGPVDRFSS